MNYFDICVWYLIRNYFDIFKGYGTSRQITLKYFWEVG